MTPEKLAEILAAHKLWLNDEEGGVRANLSRANLSRADLRWANLREADLRGADLSGADLSGAKELLSAVNFIDAHFERVADGYIAYKPSTPSMPRLKAGRSRRAA